MKIYEMVISVIYIVHKRNQKRQNLVGQSEIRKKGRKRKRREKRGEKRLLTACYTKFESQ